MTTRALLIGVESYPHFPDARLRGPVADVRLMAAALTQLGLNEQDLRLLLDEAATAAGVRAALAGLADATGPGDGVVLYYSGHGSQRARAAPEGQEADGREEVLVPYDSDHGDGENTDIPDDEIAAWLAGICERAASVTLVFDCCHSGSLDRRDGARRVPSDRRPRVGPRPVRRAQTRGGSGWLALSPRYTLLAACRDDEVSREIDTPQGRHGALTWFLTQALLAPGAVSRSWAEVFEQVASALNREIPAQHPQLEGEGDRALFGRDRRPPRLGLRVVDRVGPELVLDGGALLGLRPGATLRLLDPDQPQDRGSLPAISVTVADPLSARATLLAPLDRPAEGLRALPEGAGPLGDPMGIRLSTDLPADLAQRLAARLSQGDLVRVAEPATIELVWVPARAQVEQRSPCPELGALERPTIAALRHAEHCFVPLDATREDALEILARNLESTARVERLLALANPDPASTLQGRVALALLRYDEAGLVEWPADPAMGMPALREGEPFSLRVDNGGDREIHASVFDVGLLGAIQLIRRVGPIPAGGSLVLDYAKRLRTAFPADFERIRDRDGRPMRLATERLVLIATSAPADLRGLQQGSYARDVAGLLGSLDEDYAVAVRSFALLR